MRQGLLSVVTALLVLSPCYGQEESLQPDVPTYITELRELAKLRDEGIITKEDFELKKRQLLGLVEHEASTPSVQVPDASTLPQDAEPNSLLQKHCKNGLLTLMKSPSSTSFLSVLTFPSPELPRDRGMKRIVATGQALDAPGNTVFIEYDSANSYGAMMRGKIACDYTDPPFFEGEIVMIPRTVFLNDKPLDKNRVRLFGSSASLEMLSDFIALSKAREGADSKHEP